MKKPLRIGVTGGIGSGKSLICKIFTCLQIPVYDADSMARNLMTTDSVLIDQIKEEFGESSYHSDGSLNREHLSKKVFNDPDKLEKLNQLVHPRVGIDSENWIERNKAHTYVVKEAALLYESGAHKSLDKIIVVTAPERLRVQRVLIRDKSRSEEEVVRIIRNQMDEEEKIKKADFIIRNDETELVVPQVLKLHERFIAFAAN
ncbi:MAG TPA: dephospho-CoA kinase [Cyclobacteriaceae bacterium]|nr:dephospho-CoA kinase [Cyclobacteriaceae bacterium]